MAAGTNNNQLKAAAEKMVVMAVATTAIAAGTNNNQLKGRKRRSWQWWWQWQWQR